MELWDLLDEYGDFYAPRFEVTVGGQRFVETDGVVSGLSVDSTLDGADRFSFAVNSPFDRERGVFSELDWETFATGTRVTVGMGYGDKVEPMLVGRIHTLKTDFPADGNPTLAISGYDLLHDLTEGTNAQSWDDATDSDVVTEVAGKSEYDLTVDPRFIEDTRIRRRKIVQERQSDFRFLTELAERNGFELFVRGKTLRFRAPKYDAEPTLVLRYGDSLRSFAPERTDPESVGEVEVRHWDPTTKREIVGSAKSEEGEGKKRVLHIPVESKVDADREAAAALARLLRGLVSGGGETVGVPEIRVGETLDLDGIDQFNNSYYVMSATHSIGSSGYGVSFEVTESMTAERT